MGIARPELPSLKQDLQEPEWGTGTEGEHVRRLWEAAGKELGVLVVGFLSYLPGAYMSKKFMKYIN